MAVTTQAAKCVAKYDKMTGDKEEILTSKWWETVRF
jgi:hypothetical protein